MAMIISSTRVMPIPAGKRFRQVTYLR